MSSTGRGPKFVDWTIRHSRSALTDMATPLVLGKASFRSGTKASGSSKKTRRETGGFSGPSEGKSGSTTPKTSGKSSGTSKNSKTTAGYRKTVVILFGAKAEAVLPKLQGQVAARLGKCKPEFSVEPVFSTMSNVILAAETLTDRMLHVLDDTCAAYPDVHLILLPYEAGTFVAESKNFHIYWVMKNWNHAKIAMRDVWPRW